MNPKSSPTVQRHLQGLQSQHMWECKDLVQTSDYYQVLNVSVILWLYVVLGGIKTDFQCIEESKSRQDKMIQPGMLKNITIYMHAPVSTLV